MLILNNIVQFLQPLLSGHPLLSRHLGRSQRCPLNIRKLYYCNSMYPWGYWASEFCLQEIQITGELKSILLIKKMGAG